MITDAYYIFFRNYCTTNSNRVKTKCFPSQITALGFSILILTFNTPLVKNSVTFQYEKKPAILFCKGKKVIAKNLLKKL